MARRVVSCSAEYNLNSLSGNVVHIAQRYMIQPINCCMSNHFSMYVTAILPDLAGCCIVIRHFSSIQGRQNRSGRRGDRRTNVLTEIASTTLCLQARSLYHLYRFMPARTYCNSLGAKESCGDLRMSRS